MNADAKEHVDAVRQESEDQLRMMIDKMPTLAWSCRPDGTTEFLLRQRSLSTSEK
jgi:hypothetical protein